MHELETVTVGLLVIFGAFLVAVLTIAFFAMGGDHD